MALKDLIINNSSISEEILDKVLKDNINLVKNGYLVMLTQKANKLANRERVLLYLCGKEAWKLLDNKDITTSVGELEKNLGIKGNTLRPLLKALKDDYKVDSNKGKYSILPQGIYSLETFLNNPEKSNSDRGKYNSKKNIKKKGGNSVTDYIMTLCEDGFFSEEKKINEIHTKLIERGVTSLKFSSLPSYLLPLIRKGVLVRKKQKTEAGQGETWVYFKN